MKKEKNQELSNEQPQIEDLAVNQDRAEEVKGGPVDHTIYVPMHVIRAK